MYTNVNSLSIWFEILVKVSEHILLSTREHDASLERSSLSQCAVPG